jgi:hypothetical protein
MLASEIFTPGTIPKYTYNPRTTHGLEEQVKDYLSTGGSVLVVSGPTKSGKSVLIDKIVGPLGIVVSGGKIQKYGDFWSDILTELDLPISEIKQKKVETTETLEGIAESGINVLVAKAGGSVRASSGSTTGKTDIQVRGGSPQSQAINGLLDTQKILVIDDFHYIKPSIQQIIVRSLKNPILRGLRVIVIAVPHKAFDIIRGEREMTGRVRDLKIPPWTQTELVDIANFGYPRLNMKVSPETIGNFATESFQSPNLMQEFCLNFCKMCGVKETLDKETIFEKVSEDSLVSFYKHIRQQVMHSDEFDRLASGPKEHGRERTKYTFSDDKIYDSYIGVLLAIAKTGPKDTIKLTELRRVFASLLKRGEAAPTSQNLSRVLTQMTAIAKKNAGTGNPVIDWERETSQLFVLDPYFSFYLRWEIAKK